MTLQIELCPYGEPALAKLRELIDQAKGDDPFLPVTVVVQRGTVGLGVRRSLASEVSPQGRPGVANVSFVTMAGLADSLAGPAMVDGGRAPLTEAVLRAAMRGALQTEAGPLLGPTREHPSTIDALVTVYRELRTVDEATLQRLADGSERAREVIALVRSARRRTMGWFDEFDVCDEATKRCATARSTTGMGSVVVYLPSALTEPIARLVRTLATQVPCTAVIGVTGDESADVLVQQMIRSLRPSQEPTWPVDLKVPLGDEVFSAPTADAELLLVLRDLMARCEEGTPPERIAIVHSGSPQYVTLLHNALQSAGIPFNGSGVRTLSASVAGRMLLGALQLTEHDWRREDVAAWLVTGPLMQVGRPIPAARWDVLSAEAGVIGSLGDWHYRLEARARSLRAEAAEGRDEGDDDDAPWRRARESEADRCHSLLTFLDDMSALVDQSPETWKKWAEWATKLLHNLVGDESALAGWPVEERAAKEAVDEAIAGLAVLDQLHVPISQTIAHAALVAELDIPAPQTTRFGSGIWVASIGAVVGLSLDALYVVGMNDGIFPGRPSDDVLIPDNERVAAQGDGSMPMRGERSVTMCRDYLAALAGAGTRVLSYPRGNQRDGRALRPSRWLLDSLAPLVHWPTPLYSSEMETVPESEHYQVSASYIGAVGAPGTPMSLDDRDLRSLLEWTSSGRPVARHWWPQVDQQLGHGMAFIAGAGEGFTRFNGNLGDAASPVDLVPKLFSASRLELFAQCPRKYFFEYVLQVLPRPESQLLLAADHRERGKLVHRILERFVGAQIGRLPGEGIDDPFAVARLERIAEEEMAAFEAAGLCGPRPTWRVEQARLRRELRTFADKDRGWRQLHGITPVAVEQAFGHSGIEPVAVRIEGRHPVHFRGTIDRIDTTSDGKRIVTDYKTGRADSYLHIDADHFLAGRKVQLTLYGHVVSDGDQPVAVRYWFVSEVGQFKSIGFEYTQADGRALEHLVDAYSETIAQGHFPANPGEDGQCDHCPYDSVCPIDRHDVWDRVKRAPALSPYVDLVEL